MQQSRGLQRILHALVPVLLLVLAACGPETPEQAVRSQVEAMQLAIDELVTDMKRRFNRDRAIVFNTVQLYRHDRLAFLAESIAAAASESVFPTPTSSASSRRAIP